MATLKFEPVFIGHKGLADRGALVGRNDPNECLNCPVTNCNGKERTSNPVVRVDNPIDKDGWRKVLKGSICEIQF